MDPHKQRIVEIKQKILPEVLCWVFGSLQVFNGQQLILIQCNKYVLQCVQVAGGIQDMVAHETDDSDSHGTEIAGCWDIV